MSAITKTTAAMSQELSPIERITRFLRKGPPDIRGGAELFRFQYPIGTIIHYAAVTRETAETILAQMIADGSVVKVVVQSNIRVNGEADDTHYKLITTSNVIPTGFTDDNSHDDDSSGQSDDEHAML